MYEYIYYIYIYIYIYTYCYSLLARIPAAAPMIFWPLQDILYFESFVHESIVLSISRPACIAHTVAILLHTYWAIYDPPPPPRPPFCTPYTMQHW